MTCDGDVQAVEGIDLKIAGQEFLVRWAPRGLWQLYQVSE